MIRTRVALLALSILIASPSQADEAFTFELALTEHDTGTLYLHGMLGDGVETELLVDTGSSYVALTAATFRRLRRLGGATHVRDVRGAMAAGRSMKIAIYRVPALALGGECTLHDVEVAVMPNATRDILGLSALRRMQPFAVSMAPARLLFSQCSDEGHGEADAILAGAEAEHASVPPVARASH